ncbi:50S ribosomal protein L25/general stress protein Ctc [Lentibacillus sediminis]|uniref:50S ribosomal protein L25/general stress protein Ctc n=1 Tax=Lentibacillus sediminis TaxID=1940529 RepID=UPI000C1B8805|nr:50S ribosomal protein L25/general stress protein Ctc [Lentibacillus sediminis]
MAVTLKAKQREDYTKAATKAIRSSGRVPGIVYGKEKENKSISVDSIELVKTVRDEGRNAIISLEVENDKSVDVMLHEYQMDPLKDELVHVDFYVVNMAQEMDVEVPLRFDGEAQGARDGGVLQQPLYELQVRAKPGNIPDEIVVDVTTLGIGDSLAVSDLPTFDDYEVTEDPDTTIATVTAPDTLDDTEEAPDENAEPELVDADAEESSEEEEK